MTSWSFSHYSTALRCMRLYKHVVVDKLPSPVPESGDLKFGSALHLGLNSLLLGEDGEAVFRIYWDSVLSDNLEYGRFKHQELGAMGLEFLRKFGKMHAKKYVPKLMEKRLYAEYKGIKLEGTADFIGDYEEEQALLDFKTSGYNYPQEKELTALQLNLYAYLAIQNGIEVPKKLGYIVFNKGKSSIQTLVWDFNKTVMDKALIQMHDYINLIQTSTSYPQNHNACIMGPIKCPYMSVCFKGENNGS